MDSSSMPALIGGRYRTIRLIGRGGMGKVFEVEHVHTGDRHALKVLNAKASLQGEAVQRFKREARAAARIKSEYVVRVTDADIAPELGGLPYLVMELLEGQDLECIARAPQRPQEVIAWMRQIAHALEKAHALGIVHRDLKPENLFLSKRADGTPHVRVLDFGIAKMSAEHEATKSGQLIGTPAYMAPEQARGDSITGATDLFSLGLIAFRLLVGRSYWRGDSVVQIINQLLYEPMPPASQRGSTFGNAFDVWFSTACHREPARRFESPAAQIEALAAALALPTRPIEVAGRVAIMSGPDSSPAAGNAPTIAASVSVITGSKSAKPRRAQLRAALVLAAGLVVVGVVLARYAVRAGPSPKDGSTQVAAGELHSTAVAAARNAPILSAADALPSGAPSAAPGPPPTVSAAAASSSSSPRRALMAPATAPSPRPPPSASGRRSDPLADQK